MRASRYQLRMYWLNYRGCKEQETQLTQCRKLSWEGKYSDPAPWMKDHAWPVEQSCDDFRLLIGISGEYILKSLLDFKMVKWSPLVTYEGIIWL